MFGAPDQSTARSTSTGRFLPAAIRPVSVSSVSVPGGAAVPSLRDAPRAGVPAPAAVSRSTNCRLQAVSRRSILAFSSWR